VSDLTGRAYRVPGEYKRHVEHQLRDLVVSLQDLPAFARDSDTADQVGEVVIVWRPAPRIPKAG